MNRGYTEHTIQKCLDEDGNELGLEQYVSLSELHSSFRNLLRLEGLSSCEVRTMIGAFILTMAAYAMGVESGICTRNVDDCQAVLVSMMKASILKSKREVVAGQKRPQYRLIGCIIVLRSKKTDCAGIESSILILHEHRAENRIDFRASPKVSGRR